MIFRAGRLISCSVEPAARTNRRAAPTLQPEFLVPQGQFQKHLHTLANIAKLLHKADFRQALEQAPDAAAMLTIIRDYGKK